MIKLDKSFERKNLKELVEDYVNNYNYSLIREKSVPDSQIPEGFRKENLVENYFIFDKTLCRYSFLTFFRNQDIGDGSFDERYDRDSVIIRAVEEKNSFS